MKCWQINRATVLLASLDSFNPSAGRRQLTYIYCKELGEKNGLLCTISICALFQNNEIFCYVVLYILVYLWYNMTCELHNRYSVQFLFSIVWTTQLFLQHSFILPEVWDYGIMALYYETLKYQNWIKLWDSKRFTPLKNSSIQRHMTRKYVL